MGRAIDELAADTLACGSVVVTGEGTAFCSGGNTSWIASEPDASVDRLRRRMMPFYRAWLSIRRLEVPTIAAVNGARHRRRPVPRPRLRHPVRRRRRQARRALQQARHARGMAGTWLLPDVVGPAHARDLLLTGRVVEADEALRLGLVSRVIDAGSFLDEVLGPPPASPRPRRSRRA